MMHHARITQRAFNTPLMVEPSKALVFLSGLGPRIAGQEITFHGPDLAEAGLNRAVLPAHASLIGGGFAEHQPDNDNRLFALIDGIALIEIAGTLVHRGAWIGQSSGLTSYEGIATAQELRLRRIAAFRNSPPALYATFWVLNDGMPKEHLTHTKAVV